ncbi:MAG: hypothetical protein GEU88_15080 [Solirubrobacterales bacterium]|nr:hypothetical protein [Solirubrobacterales bacterium]
MAEERRNGEPTELIYLPEPSWAPVLLAAGLAAAAASAFIWWPYGAIGAIVALFALLAWVRDSRASFARLPRHQRLTSAVLPAVPLKRPERPHP